MHRLTAYLPWQLPLIHQALKSIFGYLIQFGLLWCISSLKSIFENVYSSFSSLRSYFSIDECFNQEINGKLDVMIMTMVMTTTTTMMIMTKNKILIRKLDENHQPLVELMWVNGEGKGSTGKCSLNPVDSKTSPVEWRHFTQ